MPTTPDSTESPTRVPEPRASDPTWPWWVGLGPLGAVVAIVFGLAFAVWLSLGLPGGTTETSRLQDHHGAARAVVFGVVVGGMALLRRLRARAMKKRGEGESSPEQEGAEPWFRPHPDEGPQPWLRANSDEGPETSCESRPDEGPANRPEPRPDEGPANRPEPRPDEGPANRPEPRPDEGPANRPEPRPDEGPEKG